MKEIVCARWGNKIDFSQLDKNVLSKRAQIKPQSLKSIRPKNYTPIATNGRHLIHEGKSKSLESFFAFENLGKFKDLIVLTHKEKQLLINKVDNLELVSDINVFEYRYPVFANIRYVSNPRENFNVLTTLLQRSEKFVPKGLSLTKFISTKNHLGLTRKIKSKNGFDKLFALADQGSYQEVFKLSEERAQRSIIALDFNSMFPSCLEGTFADPSTIRHVRYDCLYDSNLDLENGLFHVSLQGIDDSFFESHHYFSHTKLGKKLSFRCKKGDTIRTLLFRNELLSIEKYFSKIHVIEGFVSSKEIYHPLFNKANSLYKQRKSVNSKGNYSEELNRLYKFSLVTLHSASCPKHSKVEVFQSLAQLRSFIDREYGFNSEGVSDMAVLKALASSSIFGLDLNDGRIQLKTPNLANEQAIYSLSSQVFANARLKMLAAIKQLSEFPSVEVCYVNVDSVHISIDKSKVDQFLVRFQDKISSDIGALKIQCIADRGYWFDIGRYWLFKNDKVIQHKNIFFNQESKTTPFIKKRLITKLVKNGHFSFVKNTTKKIESTFSYSKRLTPKSVDTIAYERYDFSEISNLSVAGDTIDNEILSSKSIKVALFNRIAT